MTKRSTGIAPIILISCSIACFAACTVAYKGGGYPFISPATRYAVGFLFGYHEMVMMSADGERVSTLLDSDNIIITPVFSSDANRIAFLDIGVSSSRPVSSTDVTLVVKEIPPPEDGLDLLTIPLIVFETEKLMIEDAVDPEWDPAGDAIFIAHEHGLDRVTLVNGEQYALVDDDRVFDVAIAPAGDAIFYSTSKNLFSLANDGSPAVSWLPDEFVPPFTNRYIRSFAFSPDGGRLALALGGEVHILDLATREVSRVAEDVHGIYWIDWLPDGDRLVYVAGLEWRRRATYGGWGSGADPEYRLVSITPKGEGYLELFRSRPIDVREAKPRLSPDGRYIALTAAAGYNGQQVVIVASDGSGVRNICDGGANGYSFWCPAEDRPDAYLFQREGPTPAEGR